MECLVMRKMLMKLIAVFLLASHIIAEDPPETATCTFPDERSVKCTNISVFPGLSDRTLIRSLTIESHNIVELSKENFENFTHLEQLYINRGRLNKIAPGTFEPIKDTIIMVNLRSNVIAELDSNVFANLSNINKIVLNSNHLTKLNAQSFVNMPKLVNLDILSNHLESIDKDAFKDLPELENLNLFNNHLTEIPFESLARLKAVKEVVLTSNNIKTIPEETNVFIPTLEDIYLDSNPIQEIRVFPNISKALQRLDLQFTEISTTTKDTWKYLPKLTFLNIGGTKFRVITAGTFEGLPNLQKLLLRDMSYLTSIGPGAFHGIKNVTSVDIAECKKLNTIDETAFMSTKVMSLFLKDSAVTYIPKNLLKWSEMQVVIVKGNPINCDCKVAWMLNSSIFGNNTGVKRSFDKLVCATPKEHFGKNVTSLHPINLTCKPLPDDHAARFATGVIIAVICFVFMTTFALIMKYRKRIMISCRRYYQYRRYKNDMVFTVEHDTSIAELEDTDGTEGRPLKDMRLETVPLET